MRPTGQNAEIHGYRSAVKLSSVYPALFAVTQVRSYIIGDDSTWIVSSYNYLLTVASNRDHVSLQSTRKP